MELGELLAKDDSRNSLPPLNYSISDLKNCPNNIELGSPVVIIGYPAFAKTETDISLVGGLSTSIQQSHRAITNGVISSYDDSLTAPLGNLSYANYFVSAKIDSGNSGGIALSKNENGLCVLGIPTWLTVGNYETQGLVQNINNIMYK